MPGWIDGYLNLGAEKLRKFGEELSLKQKRQTNEKTCEAIDQDVEAVASSDIFRAFEADLKLFGKSAFQKPLADEDPPE